MNDIQKIARSAIAEVVKARKPAKTAWAGSPLAELMRMEIDSRGSAGELLVVKLLKESGREVVYNQDKTAEDKHWDFMCGGFRYEVKTATVGKDGKTFQHENVFRTRQYDGLIFVDIAPREIYISMWAKAAIRWRDVHSRKDSPFYKWDTSLTADSRYARGKRNKWCVRDNAVRAVAEFMSRFEEMEGVIRAKKRSPASL